MWDGAFYSSQRNGHPTRTILIRGTTKNILSFRVCDSGFMEILVPTIRVLPALINFAFIVLAPWRYIPHIGRWLPVLLNGFGFIINFPNDEIDDVQLKPGNNNRGPAPGSVAPFRTFWVFLLFPARWSLFLIL